MKNIVEKVEKWRKNGGHFNSYYDLDCKSIRQLANNNMHRCELILESFRYGYMQGVKANQAEMKKKAMVK